MVGEVVVGRMNVGLDFVVIVLVVWIIIGFFNGVLVIVFV